MGKRFTETRKWEDPFYRGLSPYAKLFWLFLHDRCDNAGVWEPDFPLAQFCMGMPVVDFDQIQHELGDRVKVIKSGKWWLTRFVKFQYTRLKPECPPHRTVFRLLEQHGISAADPWIAGDTSPEEPPAALAVPIVPLIPIFHPNAGLLQAIADAQGVDLKRVTIREKDNLVKALKLILEAEPGATAEQLTAAAAAWRQKYPKIPVTAKVLVDHWSELAPAQRSGEQVAKHHAITDEIAQLRRDLARYMHKPFGQVVARPELTDEQLEHARQLSERIDELGKQL